MPVLERLKWNRMRFRDDGESCSLPSLKALSIQNPHPDAMNPLDPDLSANFDSPLLEELEIDGAHALALLPGLLLVYGIRKEKHGPKTTAFGRV
ncbi:hypothetical protein DL93DRAFT_2168120 [Clavulina sp. PMI_390]|nr:hypothetical protein DL93DRAFT_2168120 [Clavulina sp. PMI_390]